MSIPKKIVRKIQMLAIPITNILLLLTCAQLGKHSLIIYSLSALVMVMYFFSLFSKPGYAQKEQDAAIEQILSKSQPIVPQTRIDFHKFNKALDDSIQEPSLGLESIIKGQKPQQIVYFGQQQKVVKQQAKNEIILLSNKAKGGSIERKINLTCTYQPKRIINQQLNTINNTQIIIQQSANYTIIPVELEKINRFCSSCKVTQPLRVRHCSECNRCILNFDHHCPWINNCVGQKNKLILNLFTISQVIYLSYIFYTIWPQDKEMINYYVYTLWILVGFCTLIGYGMICMQCFFIGRNITTWEYMRWNRIEYTSLFDQNKLKSLFDLGFFPNWTIFMKSNWESKPTKWKKYLSREAHLYVVNQETQTERKLVQ